MTYDTTVGDKTAQVQSSIAVLGTLENTRDDLVLGKLALLDGLVDADDILPDDTASTNVQVADLRVAHEALGEADGERGSFELGVAGVGGCELVHDRGLCVGDGIAILGRGLGGHTPTVNDDCKGIDLSVCLYWSYG